MTASKQLKLFFIIIACFVSYLCFSQKADRRYIDSILSKRDTTLRLTEHMTYVINGIPFDTLTADRILTKFEVKNLLDVAYWNGKKHGKYPYYGDAAIIVFAHPQSMKSKRKALKSAKKFLNNDSPPTVLLVDDIEINQSLKKSTLENIRLKDIMYLDAIQFKEQNTIRIWTRH